MCQIPSAVFKAACYSRPEQKRGHGRQESVAAQVDTVQHLRARWSRQSLRYGEEFLEDRLAEPSVLFDEALVELVQWSEPTPNPPKSVHGTYEVYVRLESARLVRRNK